MIVVLVATGRVLKALAEPGPLAWPFVKEEVKCRRENHLGPLKGSKIQPVQDPLLHILCRDMRETAELHINYENGLKQQAFCSVSMGLETARGSKETWNFLTRHMEMFI